MQTINPLPVGQKITVVKGFAYLHRAGTDAQIAHSITVLISALSAGDRISDALIRAESAYKDARLLPARRITINRRIASPSINARPSPLLSC